jgi:hypothetical protein
MCPDMKPGGPCGFALGHANRRPVSWLTTNLYQEGPDVNGYSFGLTNKFEGASGDELSSLYRFLDGKTGSVGELRLVQFSQGRQMRPD